MTPDSPRQALVGRAAVEVIGGYRGLVGDGIRGYRDLLGALVVSSGANWCQAASSSDVENQKLKL